MSKGVMSPDQKKCATCQHWMGFRDIIKNNNKIVYESDGQCMSARSPKKGKRFMEHILVFSGINGALYEKILIS